MRAAAWLRPPPKSVLRWLSIGANGSSAASRPPHTVLGLQAGATPEEIKYAYRRMALAHHPDRFSKQSERKAAEEEFKAIGEAYNQLLSPMRRGPSGSFTPEEAERLFWQIFGADGNIELAWHVPGRSRTPVVKGWQEYQALIGVGDDARFTSGDESRSLYRECLRALRHVDDHGIAIGVKEHARGLLEANANETDAKVIRNLLVDGRHQLDEMIKCLGTAVVAEAPPQPASPPTPTASARAGENKTLSPIGGSEL
jgi:hypothetical protein